jgi:aminoglycoside phosphotransferase (APT) family kinase protein
VPESLTKHPLAEAELKTLVRAAFGPDIAVAQSSELTEGSYNTAIAVTLDDGRDLVLKVAPAPHLRLLTHEVDLMRTEVDVYHHGAAAGVAVPTTVYADFSRTVIGTDYAFLSRVDGVSFDTVRDSMTAEALASVRGQVATAATTLHRITGSAYGYPLRGSRSWQPTWRASFLAMVEDILDDAVRLNSRLPMTPQQIGQLFRRHADVLDDVDRPALVHFDLWDGNVFVVPDETLGWRVTGLIDGERALYGDPVSELVSLGLFREFDETTLAPFGELDDRAWRRLDLYTNYLYVIMAVEGATRGWDSHERRAYEAWLGHRLGELLARLESAKVH